MALTDQQRQLRSNLRNAWLAESATDITNEASNRAKQDKWFETAVLLELACEVYEENAR